MGFGCGMESLVESYEDDIFGLLGINTSMVAKFWTDMSGVSDEIKELLSEDSPLFGGMKDQANDEGRPKRKRD